MDLFRRKSVTDLQKEAETDHSLKRALGALNLTTLGIGAIIGTGIFVLTGVAAHDKTGPALVLSFVAAGLANATTLGATSKLVGPSFGASAYPVIKSPCTLGTDCDVTSVVLTAKGALYPTSAPATVSISDTTGAGCTATATMAGDSYGTSYKVNSVGVDCSASNHSYSSGARVSISHSYSVSSWDQWGIQCSRCHTGAVDGNHGDKTLANAKGGDIVALCMTCHRMESDTAPRSVQGGNGFAGNNGFVLPYTNKQQQPDGFAHHPDGNEFLNSPHGLFTGRYNQIADTSLYGTHFNEGGACSDPQYTTRTTCEGAGQTWTRFTGGCATCHDVHQSTVPEAKANFNAQPIRRECGIACHSSSANLATMSHPTGPGTPFSETTPTAEEKAEACVICHMPKPAGGTGLNVHVFRINTSADYSTFPKQVNGVWTPGYCSDPNYNTRDACVAAGKTWDGISNSAPE